MRSADEVLGEVLDDGRGPRSVRKRPHRRSHGVDGLAGDGGCVQSTSGGLVIRLSAAARAAGVERIVYLGGLGDPETALSPHLRSRQETGGALRESGVPVTEFRAAVIVGAGLLSFEMIRYLTERLPVMICPRWVFARIQPIAIRDVLDYLVAALHAPESAGRHRVSASCAGTRRTNARCPPGTAHTSRTEE